MSFISALKKLNPIEVFSKATTVVNFVLQLIDGVEAIKNATGSEKKARVLSELDQRTKDVEDLIGKDAINNPVLRDAASNMIDAIVAFKNAYKAAHDIKN